MIDFVTGAPIVPDLNVRWIHGSRSGRRNTDPPVQVHASDPHTYILRQSKAVSFEAPFLYLFFGNDRALLLDTGATSEPEKFPLRATVDDLIGRWLTDNPRPGYELVVAHTHGHGDHVAGDAQFTDRPDTTVVAREAEAVQEFFGLASWPEQVAEFDLGGRILKVTGVPGHHAASIAIYDPWTGFLLTGDTVYPGRLYVQDMAAFTASLGRLSELAATRRVTHVMGCHIEMTTRPRRDYPVGTRYQPDEPPLQMTVAQLTAIRDAAADVAQRPGAHYYDDFAIYNGRSTGAVLRQVARAIGRRLTGRG
jgi:hydroxyacylglutathione hydrolase